MRVRTGLLGMVSWAFLSCAPGLAGEPPKVRPDRGKTMPAEAAALNPVVAGNTAFACDLYARLKVGPGNLFFSPYSVSTALAMTSAGARGATAGEMAATLHLPADPDTVHPAFRALGERLNAGGGRPGVQMPDTAAPDYELRVANALWGQRGEGFLPAFLDLTRRDYGAGLREVDFRADADAARREINAWVQHETRDKVRDLVPPGLLGPDSSLVLTNAIYFLAAWAHPFPAPATETDAPFTTADGRKVPVPMMRQTERLAYAESPTWQALELPYRGDALAMVVLLPKAPDGLARLEATLDARGLDACLKLLKPARVEVGFPRFKLTEEFDLSETLAALGMPSAFDPKRADFSGMNGRRDLLVSKVLHKAFVAVDEAGTEAAAATAVLMVRGMAVQVPEPLVRFRADHPFVFLIRERATGSVLFLGRLVAPGS